MKRRALVVPVVPFLAVGAYGYLRARPEPIVLTGIVTTEEVIVSPQIAGQLGQLLVREGDQVKKGQLLAVIKPDELKADSAYHAENVAGLASQVRESEAAVRFQERQLADQVAQAESTLASIEAQAEAACADARPGMVARLVRASLHGRWAQRSGPAEKHDPLDSAPARGQALRVNGASG